MNERRGWRGRYLLSSFKTWIFLPLCYVFLQVHTYTQLFSVSSSLLLLLLLFHFPDLYPLHVACDVGASDVVEALLSAGAKVDARDSFSWTPLHFAVERNHMLVVGVLMRQPNLPIDAADNAGYVESRDSTEIGPIGSEFTQQPLSASTVSWSWSS